MYWAKKLEKFYNFKAKTCKYKVVRVGVNSNYTESTGWYLVKVLPDSSEKIYKKLSDDCNDHLKDLTIKTIQEYWEDQLDSTFKGKNMMTLGAFICGELGMRKYIEHI